MRYTIEGFGKIKQDEERDHPPISGQPNIFKKPDERRLGAAAATEFGLVEIQGAMEIQMDGYLIVYYTLKYFRKEAK